MRATGNPIRADLQISSPHVGLLRKARKPRRKRVRMDSRRALDRKGVSAVSR
jgi:hypothetical protein